MITTSTSFTHEYLSSLKFKELQKLSVKFHVNKRWAKKQELIENLLSLSEKCKAASDDKQLDEKEWIDGGTIFNNLMVNSSNELNRRLTFSINTKPSTEALHPHAALEVHQNENKLLCETISSRETYDIPPTEINLNIAPLDESRATFDIPPKQNLINEVDSRATFDVPKNGGELLKESEINILNEKLDKGNSDFKNFTNADISVRNINESEFTEELEKIKFKLHTKNEKCLRRDGKMSQVKMLTIPHAKITRRTKKDEESSKANNSPIKMSKKSINIRKSTRLPVSKTDLVKSPAFSSIKKSINKQIIFNSDRGMKSRVPVRLQFTEENCKSVEKTSADFLKNSENKSFHQKMHKLDDVFEKKSNSVKISFRIPSASTVKNSGVMPVKKTPLIKDSNQRNISGRPNSSFTQTPATGAKPSVASKPITATKMPDFSKIHKRHFDQMDSLHDYLMKKEERRRKLFGTPQPGQQLQVQTKSAPLFQFQSGVAEKGSKGKENFKNISTPLQKKEKGSKVAQKEAFKSRLPPTKLQADIKDKNRSHILGVRTNKRFELQMKLRNM